MSECLTCTFRVNCCSVGLRCHGHKYRPSPVPLSGTGKKGGGSKGDRLYWRVQGIGSRWRVFEVLWNFECSVGLSQKRNMFAFQ